MKPTAITNNLTGTFTNRVADVIAHSCELSGVSPDNMLSIFRQSVNKTRENQLYKLGKTDVKEIEDLLLKPALLLPAHYALPHCDNLVSSISIPPELAIKLSLKDRQEVDVQINPASYTPEKGLVAIAARTAEHPQWVFPER